MEEALQTIIKMIDRSANTKTKFEPGTSQYTLQKNRVKALSIILELIKTELGRDSNIGAYSKEDFRTSLAPINSLVSKSEKARMKLAKGSWQRDMLETNLKALNIALPILREVAK